MFALPKDAKKTRLIQACKQRWRVGRDRRRELKTGLGHYEDRKWVGWHHHHHVTLVAGYGGAAK